MGYIIFFFTGLFFSMVGLGGGSVYVPFFTILGYDIKSIAIPGGIFLVFVTGLSSSINYIIHKQVNYRISVPILIGAVSTSLLAQAVFYRNAGSKSLLLIMIIGIFIAGLRSLILPEKFGQVKIKKEWGRFCVGIILGVVVGFISVMTGIGGGFLMVPVLIHFSYPIKEAVGTSVFVILFTSCTGFVTHYFSTFNKNTMPELLIYGGIVFIGALIGSRINAKQLKSHQVKIIMGIGLTALSIYFFIKEIL